MLVPLALTRLSESRGPAPNLDLPGLALIGPGLLGITYGAIRGQALGWTSATILGSFAVGMVFVIAFVAWELRARAPMLPMRFFRTRTFAATNGLSFAMYFGVFGSIFLLAQFFQTTQGYSPAFGGTADASLDRHADDRRADRRSAQRPHREPAADGCRPRVAGHGDRVAGGDHHTRYRLRPPDRAVCLLAGTGMALVFAPSANAVFSSVSQQEAGQASGATNAIRELGGVIGVAVLASVFSAHGSYLVPRKRSPTG